MKSPFIKRQKKGSKSKSTKFKSCVALARLTIDSNASPCPNHQNWDIQNLDWGKQYKITKSCGLSIMSLPINYIKSRWCFFSNQKNIYSIPFTFIVIWSWMCPNLSQALCYLYWQFFLSEIYWIFYRYKSGSVPNNWYFFAKQ